MSKSRITTKGTAARKRLPPIHPGDVLVEDLMDLGLSLNQLARALRVPMNRISAIANRKRSITADTAMRLARYFGTSAQYWLNLQTAYDLAVAERAKSEQIERDVLPRQAA
jgi:addiction module HigA family antidote